MHSAEGGTEPGRRPAERRARDRAAPRCRSSSRTGGRTGGGPVAASYRRPRQPPDELARRAARRDVPWSQPAGAVQVTVEPGDVVFFDAALARAVAQPQRRRPQGCVRRLHLPLGPDPRRGRDLPRTSWWSGLNPVQQQLLGGVRSEDGDHQWGHDRGRRRSASPSRNRACSTRSTRRSSRDPAVGLAVEDPPAPARACLPLLPSGPGGVQRDDAARGVWVDSIRPVGRVRPGLRRSCHRRATRPATAARRPRAPVCACLSPSPAAAARSRRRRGPRRPGPASRRGNGPP